MKFHLEYVWIGLEENMYSKVRVVDIDKMELGLGDCEVWNFDGSSTGQSTTKYSDILIRPVRLYKNPFVVYLPSYLVLCECLNTDGTTHETNYRENCVTTLNINKHEEYLFGIEQEYSIFGRVNVETMMRCPYGWLNDVNPEEGNYTQTGYCGVGGNKIFCGVRNIMEDHMRACLCAGVKICGMNLEVANSSAEFQIGTCGALEVCDDLWMARYILMRVAESYGLSVSFHPKPFGREFNGCGCHTNVSTKNMRNDIKYIYDAINKIRDTHGEFFDCYGTENELRLSGKYETSEMDIFTYGVGDRTGTIRIPIQVANAGKGYFEYRFPASNMNPYRGVENLMWIISE